MGNKSTTNKNNLHNQNSVPASVATGAASIAARSNHRRCSEIKYKSTDSTDRPAVSNGGDSSTKFNSMFYVLFRLKEFLKYSFCV